MLQKNERALTQERILTFGEMGSGKSNGWANIRKWYEMTDTPGHFYIVSTEWAMAHRTAEGYLDGTPGNNFFSNASIVEAWDYESLVAAHDEVATKAGAEDWIVIDSVTNHWQWVQDAYAMRHFGGVTMQEHRAEGGRGEMNWQKVNSDYRNLVLPIFTRHPAHVYACAQGDTVKSDGIWKDSKEVQQMFGRFGIKPVGQKQLGYQFHTVLLMKHPSKDEWTFTTVDDPSREKKTGEIISEFTMSYLLQVAGWQVVD